MCLLQPSRLVLLRKHKEADRRRPLLRPDLLARHHRHLDVGGSLCHGHKYSG